MGQSNTIISCSNPKRVVLVGGGHANVQVVKYLAENFLIEKDKGFQLTMISDYPSAFYSGMLPGSISGRYKTEEIQIDLEKLCKWCGAEFIHDKMISIDWQAKEIICESNVVPFDYTCINIGSQTKHSDLPGVMEYAITTRPISELLLKIEKKDKELSLQKGSDRNRRVIVVGSGAAGLELAWAFRARLEDNNLIPKITLVHCGKEKIFEYESPSASKNIYRKLKEHSVDIVHGIATEISSTGVSVDGSTLEYDYLIWATGAKPPDVLQHLSVQLCERGYIQVNQHLQSTSHDCLFAVGDCCTFLDVNLPKAGVYSVREGPIVGQNLKNIIVGEELESYTPQKGFLSLLNTSDGQAIANYKGTSYSGSMAMHLKDKIDRKFMDLFNPQLLGTPPQPNK